MEIDTSTDFGARVARHLEDDQVVWLATVGPMEPRSLPLSGFSGTATRR